MLANADCTVFELGGTKANPSVKAVHKIKNVYWNDMRGMTVTKNGVQISDSIIVYIYGGDFLPKSGDIIVRGLVDIYTENYGEFIQKLQSEYPENVVIKSVNDYRFGGLPHIEITAR